MESQLLAFPIPLLFKLWSDPAQPAHSVSGDPPHGYSEARDEHPSNFTLYTILTTVLYSLQIAILVAACCIRFFHYKSVGKSPFRMIVRPSYVGKVLLHSLIVLALIIQLISYVWPGGNFIEQWIRTIMISGQIVCWIVSAYMLRFELLRNLGHAWYMHHLFAWLSVVVYLTDFLYTYFNQSGFGDKQSVADTVQLITMFFLVLLSLIIGIMVMVYPKEEPYGGRGYVPGVIHSEGLVDPFHSVSRQQSVCSNSSRQVQKKMPIITAKLSSSVTINKDRPVVFQLITRENGNFLTSTKVTYQNFKSLDDVFRAKYSRQIQRGQLRKRELPAAGNMTTMIEVSSLRDQLNLYLAEILKVSARQLTGTSTPELMRNSGNLNNSNPQKDSNVSKPLLISDKSSSQVAMAFSADRGEYQSVSPPFSNKQDQPDGSNKSSEVAPHEDHVVEFSTENNSLVPVGKPTQTAQQYLNVQCVSTRGEKTQGFLPRELLTFLNVDAEKIESIMHDQNERHPSMFMPIPNKPRDSSGLGTSQPNSETQRDVIFDEVRKLLIKVCSQEEFFSPKFDVAPMGRASQLTFLIKVNNEFVFEKTLSETVAFCSEMNSWADGKNPQLEQLHFMMQDTFQIVTAQGKSIDNVDPMMQGLAGHMSQHNTSYQQQNHSTIVMDRTQVVDSLDQTGVLPRNLEQALQNLEYSFWYILNNPCCYNTIVYRFFHKSSMFCMFPYVDTFLRTFRLTGKEMITPPAQPMGLLRNFSAPGCSSMHLGGDANSGLLEEIAEVAEEQELKRDTGTAESAGCKALSSCHQVDPLASLHNSGNMPRSPSQPDSSVIDSTVGLQATDFPYQPRDLIEWVQLRVRPVTHKVTIAFEHHAFTQYEMELTQRTELADINKNVIRITGGTMSEGESRFDIKIIRLRFGVKELFQMLMLNCQSFTEADIPDKLWQEAEYGINEAGNEFELEKLLNDKILKNLEVMMHPAMRNFFEVGRDRATNLNDKAPQVDLIHQLSQQSNYGAAAAAAQNAGNNDDLFLGRTSSLTNDDRVSTSSQRWPSNLMPANLRMSKTRGWIAEQQQDLYRGLQLGSRTESRSIFNRASQSIGPHDLHKQVGEDMSYLTAGLGGNHYSGAGPTTYAESPLDPSMLPRLGIDDNEDEQNYSLRDDFRL